MLCIIPQVLSLQDNLIFRKNHHTQRNESTNVKDARLETNNILFYLFKFSLIIFRDYLIVIP